MYKIVKGEQELFVGPEEKDAAKYLFEHFQYKKPDIKLDLFHMNQLVADTQIDAMIEKYYQAETNRINERIKFENTNIGRKLVQFNIVANWYFEYFKMVKLNRQSREHVKMSI